MVRISYSDTTLEYRDMSSVRKAVREILNCKKIPESIDITACAGLYSPEDFVFTSEDCSDKCMVSIIGEEGAVINGGITVEKCNWKKPDAEMYSRFDLSAADYIRMIDLFELGLDKSDWGAMQAIGAYNTANLYDSSKPGKRCDCYCGGKRMTSARYPDEGFLKISAVMDVGDVGEFPEQNYFAGWGNRRNQRGGTYVIDRTVNARMKKWKEPEKAWMFGYFYHDWADSSTPLKKVDTENRLVYPEYVSRYGCRAGANYYFYNIPEELDREGEWYLDRENGKLYFYPYKDAEVLDFCCDDRPLVSFEKTENMTFEGFTLKCTMENAVICSGNNMILKNLKICSIGGNAITVNGKDNLIAGCEIAHTGRGGITVCGGDRNTLTHGGNRVTNNYIHDISEIYLTYQSGISLTGVGNIADHNEICRSPHMAVGYSGNEHIIEYNYIHDVVLQSSDAGAIYSGYDWTAHGTVIRYNILEHIGAGDFRPDGIYWDDGLSGQTACCNILIDVRKNGFLAGGGRENVIENNVLINCATPISYDDRNRDGFVNDGWARSAVNNPRAGHWKILKNVPYESDIWKAKYPRLADIITDFEKYDNPDFPCNPSYSSVKNNVIIDEQERGPWYAQSVPKYSTVENNNIYKSISDSGFDINTGKFDNHIYKDIPVSKIGRNR